MSEKEAQGGNVMKKANGRRRLFKLAAGFVVGAVTSGLVTPLTSRAQPTAGRHILVAYYSRTGSTRDMAEQIHARVGGDLFELKTVHNYPVAYRATTEQAKREQEAGFRPVLATPVTVSTTWALGPAHRTARPSRAGSVAPGHPIAIRASRPLSRTGRASPTPRRRRCPGARWPGHEA